ncbi:MAG: NADH-quinone oxidoreductase subunit F, partial [Sphingomonadales bacterium]|nr:NADH-quinone oxidoreductase subunit F [Sphingomonadales bacterium]
GISMGLLTEAELDTPLDFAALMGVDCLGLGTAAVIVLDETVSIVDFLHNSCRFFAHESCGQCTPCREGTGWMWRVMERLVDGRADKAEIDMLLDVTYQVEGHTICALGDAAAWPIQGLIRHFRDDIEARIDAFDAQKAAAE